MNKRIESPRKSIEVEKCTFCIEKNRLLIESFKETDGGPMILRRANERKTSEKSERKGGNKSSKWIDDFPA